MKTIKTILRTPAFIISLTLFYLSGGFCWAQSTTTVDLLKGEKWWGLYVSGSPAQSFGEPFSLQTMQPGGGVYTVSVLLSSNGRYIYSHEPLGVSFDGERITVVSPGEKIEVNKGGRNLREAYLLCCHNNFAPEGTMPDEALFTLPQYETAFDPGCFSTQDEIIAYATRLLDEGFPAGILVIADGWDQPNTLFKFSQSLFPDPAAMVEKLHSMGFKVMLTVTPYCSPYGKHFLDGMEHGIFVTGKKGKPVIVSERGGYAVCYDFTGTTLATEARKNLRDIITSYGIDGLRFECTGLLAALGADSPAANKYVESWINLAPGIGMCQYLPYVGSQFAPYITGIAMQESGDPGRTAFAALFSAGITGYPYSTIVNLLPDNSVPSGDGPWQNICSSKV